MSDRQRDALETALYVLVTLGACLLLLGSGCTSCPVECTGPRHLHCAGSCVVMCQELPRDAGVWVTGVGDCLGVADCRESFTGGELAVPAEGGAL